MIYKISLLISIDYRQWHNIHALESEYYIYIYVFPPDVKCILIKGQELCTQGSIRLQGGTNTNGYVEVCHNNIWGTVCGNSNWGLADAQVACRQLGFPSSGATSNAVSAVPDGTRVSWLNYVSCNGTESNLFNCDIRFSKMNCDWSQYAGVSCQDSKSQIFKLLSFLHIFLRVIYALQSEIFKGKNL